MKNNIPFVVAMTALAASMAEAQTVPPPTTATTS